MEKLLFTIIGSFLILTYPVIAFSDSDNIQCKEDFVLIEKAPHPLTLPAYRFEGHSYVDRQRLKGVNLMMRIYMRKILLNAIKERGLV